MAIVSERTIARTSFFLILVVISLITFGVAAYFVVTRNEISSGDLDRLERTLLEQRKETLRAEVDRFQLRIESLSRSLQERDDLAGDRSSALDDDSTEAVLADLLQQRVLAELGGAGDLSADSFFIYKLHRLAGGSDFATMLYNPSRPDLVGQKLSTDFADARGLDFRKVFMKDIRDHGDSFVIYWYNRGEEGAGHPEPGRKLAYFRHDPEWNWILAKSVYLDSLDQWSAERRAGLRSRMLTDFAVLAAIFVAGVVLALFLAYSFSLSIHDLLKKYRDREARHLLEIDTLSKTLDLRERTDRLTGVSTRGHFSEELGREKSRSDRYRLPLTMILFDVDRFRDINDRLGGSVGDAVLRELAALIGDNIRRTDIFARWSGGQFAILAPGVDREQGMLFAEKLRDLVAGHDFSVGGEVTCSFGASFHQLAESIEQFVQRAEKALQQAKKSGRNRCVAL